ncbi:MAG: HipA domain-containing protein [Desulfobacteraceae bacterium]|jgi:serine/threonine-protein kinase HipA
MTSEAFVWIWLPGETEAVLCGKLQQSAGELQFYYGKRYLERTNAISLDARELPLESGVFRPRFGEMHSVIRDASPDAWGRRVLLYRLNQRTVTELDYLTNAGFDRIGALVMTQSSDQVPLKESETASMDQLVEAAEFVENGQPLPDTLVTALVHGSSVGGARPKALLYDYHEDYPSSWIAKFSSSTDQYPVVRSELAAMWLAGHCRINVPALRLVESLGKDVLLVERFDRIEEDNGIKRRMMISGLTALQLHETESQLASYLDLTGFIRRYAKNALRDNAQLFRRMLFNILIGNNDDHARNHAFFWDGTHYHLTPAYDICPMLRSGMTASQAMVIGTQGRRSTIKNALSEAGLFGLAEKEAAVIVEELVEKIETLWDDASDYAHLTKFQSDVLRKSTILSEGVFFE